MLDGGKQLALAWLKGATEILLFYPILLLLSPLSGFQNETSLWLLFLTVFMPLGAAARMAVRFDIRILLILIGTVLVGGISWLAYGLTIKSLATVIVGGVLYYHGFRSIRTPWYILFPVGLFWISLFLYLFAALLFPNIPNYEPYVGGLTGFGLLSLALTFLLSNSTNLKTETNSGRSDVRLSGGVKWKNRLLLLIVLLVIFVIGMFGTLKSILQSLKQQLLLLIGTLISWINQLFAVSNPESGPPPQGGGMPELPPPEPPSALAQFLDRLLVIIGITLSIVLGAIALYFLSKLAIRYLRKLLAWMKERAEAASAGVQEYEEEKDSLLDWNELRGQINDQIAVAIARFRRDPAWETLDSVERIRLLYRLYLRKNANGKPFQPHLTPSEQLAGQHKELADAYNDVRYGEAHPDNELSERLKRETGLLK